MQTADDDNFGKLAFHLASICLGLSLGTALVLGGEGAFEGASTKARAHAAVHGMADPLHRVAVGRDFVYVVASLHDAAILAAATNQDSVTPFGGPGLSDRVHFRVVDSPEKESWLIPDITDDGQGSGVILIDLRSE